MTRIARYRWIAALAAPVIASAHSGSPVEPHDLWRAWSFEPGIILPLLATAVLYARGARPSRGDSYGRMACFWAGWLLLAIALISPLHPLSEALFSAHMAQHEILMIAAAPLLVLSRPMVPFLRAFPLRARRVIGGWSRIMAEACAPISRPSAAWCIHAAALWLWHIPVAFEATLRNEWIHAAQHLSFFLSALLFWWSLFDGHRRQSPGAGIIYVFTTAIHTSILGALLTLTNQLWYPVYSSTTAVWGLTPIEDQQLGGLIMWVPAGLVYLAAGLGLLATWLRRTGAAAVTATSCIVLLAGCSLRGQEQAIAATGGDPSAGASAIVRYGCGSCHTIDRITGAHGLAGPPLTGVGRRLYIAGQLANSPDNLTYWIQHPASVNPKTLMPELGVTPKDAVDIAAFLYSLD